MTSVAIVRRGEADGAHIVESLHRIGHRILDVRHRSAMRIRLVSDRVESVCQLLGRELDEVDALIYLGMPGLRRPTRPATRDEIYIQAETEQAFIALLWSRANQESTRQRPFKILNNGFVFGWNRSFFSAGHHLRALSRIGWPTGSSTSIFDFERGATYKYRVPLADARNTHFFSLSARRFIISPAIAPDHPALEVLPKLAHNTQLHMAHSGLDWCSIPLLIDGPRVYAFGFSVELPTTLNPGEIDALLSDCLPESLPAILPNS